MERPQITDSQPDGGVAKAGDALNKARGGEMRNNKDDFTHGYLAAAAQVARAGHDSLAEDMMGECGVTTSLELTKQHLENFDEEPLMRVLQLVGR